MLKLVDSKTGLDIQIEIPVNLSDALRRQLTACQSRSEGDFGDRLAPLLGRALVSAMDPDWRPPTEKEISQAALICARTGASVPQEAWSSRVMLRDFIERHGAGSGRLRRHGA